MSEDETEEKLATAEAYPCVNCGFSVVNVLGGWTHRDGGERCFPLVETDERVAAPDATFPEPILELPETEVNLL